MSVDGCFPPIDAYSICVCHWQIAVLTDPSIAPKSLFQTGQQSQADEQPPLQGVQAFFRQNASRCSLNLSFLIVRLLHMFSTIFLLPLLQALFPLNLPLATALPGTSKGFRLPVAVQPYQYFPKPPSFEEAFSRTKPFFLPHWHQQR